MRLWTFRHVHTRIIIKMKLLLIAAICAVCALIEKGHTEKKKKFQIHKHKEFFLLYKWKLSLTTTTAAATTPTIDPRGDGEATEEPEEPEDERLVALNSTENANLELPDCGKPNYSGSSRRTDHPWQAYIMNGTSFLGNGIILDSYHILTRASSVYKQRKTPGKIKVYMGVNNPSTTLDFDERRTVKNITIANNFNKTTLKHNLAILRLSEPVYLANNPNITNVCTPFGKKSFQGQSCKVIGWSKSTSNSNAKQKQVNTTIIKNSACKAVVAALNTEKRYSKVVLHEKEMCVNSKASEEICKVQNGGSPLICIDQNDGRSYVVGIASRNRNCESPRDVEIFVNISKYAEWIELTTNKIK